VAGHCGLAQAEREADARRVPTGRRFLGVELSEEYFGVAEERIQENCGTKAAQNSK